MYADTGVNLASAMRVGIKKQPGPSSRFKSSQLKELNSNNTTGRSKKAMRRLRQKNRKHQQPDTTKIERCDLKKEVDMLKFMKRGGFNSDNNTVQTTEDTVVNGTVQNGKCGSSL